jgi:hypothetical protein
MKIGKIIELEEVASGWSPVYDGVEYTDASGARVFIPESLLVRLYEGVKWDFERKNPDGNWAEHCDRLFN